MYHLQRERTQGYRAPIANGTYNSTMISKMYMDLEVQAGFAALESRMDIIAGRMD